MSEADAFLARVEEIAESQNLQPLEAALVVSVGEGVAQDTMSFGRVFGVGHALALRAAAALEGGLLRATSTSAKSRRMRLELTEAGAALFGRAAQAA